VCGFLLFPQWSFEQSKYWDWVEVTVPYWLMNDAAVQGLLEHLRLRLRACPTFFLVIITTFCFKAHSVFPLLLSCCAVCEGMLTRSGRAVDSHSHPSGIPNRQAFSCNDYQMGKDVDQNRNNGNSLSAMDSSPSLPSRFPAQRGLSVRPPVCPQVPPSASQLLVWALTASQKKKSNSYPIRTVPK